MIFLMVLANIQLFMIFAALALIWQEMKKDKEN